MSDLRKTIIDALKSVFDPEIPVNIYELGLIYELKIDDADDGAIVDVRMTLTSPNCPVADKLPQQVRDSIVSLQGVKDATVALVWEPPWTPDRMSDLARLELELRGVNVKSSHESTPRLTNVSIGRSNRPRT
jgi:FeS assembly SUF system protein